MEGNVTQTPPRPKSHKLLFIVGGTLIFILAVATSFFFWQYSSLKADPNVVSKEKTEMLKEKVSKLYSLPDETPTVAEISDKEKLKDQPFFDNTENGDVLFIFPNAKQAILYRESTNKLINVGPINLTNEAAAKEPSQDKQ